MTTEGHDKARSTRSAGIIASILLVASLVVLFGVIEVVFVISLEDSDLYERVYYLTYAIQPYLVISWYIGLLLSFGIILVTPFTHGRTIYRLKRWKAGVVITLIGGIPMVLIFALGMVIGGSP